MKLSHRPAAVSSAFDDPNLVSAAGLVPAMGLASSTGLGALVGRFPFTCRTISGPTPG